MKRKPLIVSIEPSNRPKQQPGFPRLMWADYDPDYSNANRVAMYGSKADQRGNRPDLKPIRVLVVALDDNDKAPIANALAVLKRCAAQGIELANKHSDRKTK
jgi:hypothetical protein